MAFNFVPAGTILPFGGATAPAGWLICDGSAVNRTSYAALFQAIATAWGYGDNSTTFNLPDMRGRFPRGRDGGAARDPDSAGRTASATGGATGDNVGSVQVNATKKNGLGVTNNSVSTGNDSPDHSHGIGDSMMGDAGGRQFNWISGSFRTTKTTSDGANNRHSHSVTSNVVLDAGDSETRPVNANVNYIIKV